MLRKQGLLEESRKALKNSKLLKNPDKPKEKSVVTWWSKAFDDCMRRKPVYYREADAIFWGIAKAAPYADATLAPLQVHTDQGHDSG